MPRIILKDKSPEFADTEQKSDSITCEMPGCPDHAQHRAPKHRGLNEYYEFCFEHVKEYNKAWNFFSGMSDSEVQDHMASSIYGDRPTWRYNADGAAEDHLYEAARHSYYFGDEQYQNTENINQEKKRDFYGDTTTPEYEAMAMMGLSPPVTLDEIKTKYKKLAKKYHPDLNKDDPNAEELLKKINMAYTILKLAFQEYKNLPENNV